MALKSLRYCFIIIFFTIIVEAEQAHDNSDCSKKIEEFFQKVSSKEVAELLIAEKKAEILKALINYAGCDARSSVLKQQGEVIKKDEDFFQPKFPKPLTEEELKKNVRQRIQEKFLGTLPELVDDLISYFSNHKKYIDNNVILNNRLLLVGEPGNGKTYLAKVLAQELQVPLLSFSASDFADKYIGEASKKIRMAFAAARNHNKPFLVFIDEIDALASKRSDNMHEENRKTLMTLLTELQDAYDNKNIFIIFATNDKDALDKAFLSRLSGKSLHVILPINSQTVRAKYFSKLFKDNNIPQDDVLAARLAEVMTGTVTTVKGENNKNVSTTSYFSNRDLQKIVIEAKFAQFKDCNDNKICNKHLCFYLRKAIDRMVESKEGPLAWYVPEDTSWFKTGKKPTYCDGI